MPRELIRDALWGRHDEDVRELFRSVLAADVDRLEVAMSIAYVDWADFQATFAKDEDSAIVVGLVFNILNRLIASAKVLVLGQLALSGASFRHAQEALAAAFVLAAHESPHRGAYLEGRFSVHKAAGMLRREVHRDSSLRSDAIDQLLQQIAFYNQFSHPTALALADTIALGGGGPILGASFDPKKKQFYEHELRSRAGFAEMLPNAMDGIAERLWKWPQFKVAG